MPPRTRRRGARAPDGVAPVNAATELKKNFFTAIRANNIERVRELIGAVDLNMIDETDNNNTPLMVVSFKGYTEIAKILIEAGVNLNQKNINGNTALIYAALANRTEIAKMLIDARANLNELDINGNTALLHSSEQGRTNIAKKLIEAGADLNIRNKFGDTALIMAVANGHNPTVTILIEAGAELNIKNAEGDTALMKAVDYEKVNVVKMLINARANVNEVDNNGNTALIISLNTENIYIAKLLINGGADLNHKNIHGYTPLMLAIANDQIEIAKILINKGANLNLQNINGETALIITLDANYEIDDDDRILIVKLLLGKRADVNSKTVDGYTALFYAASNSYTEILKLLLAKNPTLTDIIKDAIKRKAFTPEILKLLIVHYSIEVEAQVPWKGQTRGNIEKFDTLFTNEESMRNWSFCPICLGWMPRADGCMYMTHTCSSMPYYHEELYNKYKNRLGEINWCTICGRICAGHYHYPIVDAKAAKPEPLVLMGAHPFETDCRISNGGGGLPEKIARIRQLRETALRLQSEVGKIGHEEAMNMLVEDAWNAAKLTRTRKLQRIKATKTWNIPATNFPANTVANTSAANVIANANDPSKYSAPVILSPGTGAAAEGRNAGYEYNSVSFADDIPLIVFKHKDIEGNKHVHPQIGKDSLLEDLMTSEERGKCFDADCGGLLYPREIELAFADPKLAPTVTEEDKKTLAKYKEWFNKWRAEDAQRGGRRRRRRQTKKRRAAAKRATRRRT